MVGASAGSRGGLGGQRGRREPLGPRPPVPPPPHTSPGLYESIRKANLTRGAAEITLNAGNIRLAGSRVVRLIVLTSDIKHGSGYSRLGRCPENENKSVYFNNIKKLN